jgi:hypothetical protein
MDTRYYACRIRRRSNSEKYGQTDKPHTLPVVAVSRRVPVAVRRPRPPRFVVPRGAARRKAASRWIPKSVLLQKNKLGASCPKRYS